MGNFSQSKEITMDSIANYYREINRGFLNKAWRQGPTIGFELYYKSQNGGVEPKFLKFADYEPETREKIWTLLETDGHERLYIHENDLIAYYEKFLIANLVQSLEDEEPFQKVLKDAYQVARMLLNEYFDNIGSTRILRSLDDVVDIMIVCILQGKLEPADIFQITEKDKSHPSHCANAGLYNMFLGVKLNLKSDDIQQLGLGGLLYDIGKKSIPKNVLEKQGKLSPEEWQFIRKHPSAGRKVLNDMKCYSPAILKMAGEHHEKFDGSGYPLGLAGEKISLFARVTAISDVFNALVCNRSHHEARTAFGALMEMKEKMPGHFDPKILLSFIKAFVPAKK